MNTVDFENSTQAWLDRLACGELDELTRKSLFAWLDAEPLRWRGCALACLETQTWNDSLGNIVPEGQVIRRGQARPELNEPNSPRKTSASRISTLATVAALLLVAFGLGTLSRGWLAPQAETVVEDPEQPAEAEPSGPLMATVSLRQERGATIPATMQIPVMAVQNSAAEMHTSSSISEYDRQKWERRGYQLTKERRFLPAELPGGKKVVVPIDHVKASYVGSKVS